MPAPWTGGRAFQRPSCGSGRIAMPRAIGRKGRTWRFTANGTGVAMTWNGSPRTAWRTRKLSGRARGRTSASPRARKPWARSRCIVVLRLTERITLANGQHLLIPEYNPRGLGYDAARALRSAIIALYAELGYEAVADGFVSHIESFGHDLSIPHVFRTVINVLPWLGSVYQDSFRVSDRHADGHRFPLRT